MNTQEDAEAPEKLASPGPLVVAEETMPLPPIPEVQGKILYTNDLLEYLTLSNRLREIKQRQPKIELALEALRERIPNLAEALGLT